MQVMQDVEEDSTDLIIRHSAAPLKEADMDLLFF